MLVVVGFFLVSESKFDLAIHVRKDRGQVVPVERMGSGSQSTRDTGLLESPQALAADLGPQWL